MKNAIKINVETQSFEVVKVGNLSDYYKAIGNGCTCFCAPVTFDNGDSVFCDDEGLYHDNIGGWIMDGFSYPLIGNAVVIGANDEGDSEDAKTTIEWLEERVIFIKKNHPALISYFQEFNY